MTISQMKDSKRITLVIAKTTNRVLEDLQHHIRRRDDRPVRKVELVHEALLLLAERVGVPVAGRGADKMDLE